MEFSIGTNPSSHAPDSTAAITSGTPTIGTRSRAARSAWVRSASSAKVPAGPKNATGGTTAHRSGAPADDPLDTSALVRGAQRPMAQRVGACGAARQMRRMSRRALARRRDAVGASPRGRSTRPHAPGAGGTARAARACARRRRAAHPRGSTRRSTAGGSRPPPRCPDRRTRVRPRSSRSTARCPPAWSRPAGTPRSHAPRRARSSDARRHTSRTVSARRRSTPTACQAKDGSVASSATVGGSRSASFGPGAGCPWARTNRAYARCASTEVTFCSSTVGTISSTGFPAHARRSPRSRRCSSAT